MPAYVTPYARFNPEWNSEGHSDRDALSLALLSLLAYRKTDFIDRKLKQWNFDKWKAFSANKGGDIDTSGFVAGNADVIVISFRGSVSRKNWIANLQAVTDPGPLDNTNVHEGFQDSLFPVIEQLTDSLCDYYTNEQKIWITGHSLGGALAVLFAAMLLESDKPVTGLYTYAAPRVGNLAFRDALNSAMEEKPHFRYANEHDIVPHIPPEPLFSHAGISVALPYDIDKIASNNERIEDSGRQFWTRIKQAFVEWYNEIVDGDLEIKAAHLLASTDGYLPRLVARVDQHAPQSRHNNP